MTDARYRHSALSAASAGSCVPRQAGGQAEGVGFFTARAVVRTDEGFVAAFAAAVSTSGVEVADLLRSRIGASDATMHVEEGFDDADPFALVMVPRAISEEMLGARSAPAARAYRGYRLFVERRFAA